MRIAEFIIMLQWVAILLGSKFLYRYSVFRPSTPEEIYDKFNFVRFYRTISGVDDSSILSVGFMYTKDDVRIKKLLRMFYTRKELKKLILEIESSCSKTFILLKPMGNLKFEISDFQATIGNIKQYTYTYNKNEVTVIKVNSINDIKKSFIDKL